MTINEYNFINNINNYCISSKLPYNYNDKFKILIVKLGMVSNRK